MNITLPFTPPDAVKRLSGALPARRMRDVLERRFGLKGADKATLEEIGQSYKITRERVRQIEADAIRRVRASSAVREIEPVYRVIGEELSRLGGVAASHDLFGRMAERKHYPYLDFLLSFNPAFAFFPEDENFYARWAVDKNAAALAEEVAQKTIAALEEKKRPVSQDELLALARSQAEAISHAPVASEHVGTYIASTKLIKINPYGEYGHAAWPTITPRGIKDKAYAALTHAGRPAHFREVAKLIDAGGWSKKKVHPQTVHNELIKDKRFVLVGRGLYALREWGYAEGSVREVIASLLKDSGRALTREEIIALASEKRMVKPQTILLNLQNRDTFRKTDDGKYALV